MASSDGDKARWFALVAAAGLSLGAGALFGSLSLRAGHEHVRGRILELNGSLPFTLLLAETEFQTFLTTGGQEHLGRYRRACDRLTATLQDLGSAEVDTGVPDTVNASGLAALRATFSAWQHDYADPAIASKTRTGRRPALSKKNAALTTELAVSTDNVKSRAEQFLELARRRYLMVQRMLVAAGLLALALGAAGLGLYVGAQRDARRRAQDQAVQLNEHARRFEVIAEFSEKIHHASSEDAAARHLVTAVGQFAPQAVALLGLGSGATLRIAATAGELPAGAAASPVLDQPETCPVMRTSQRFHVGNVDAEPVCACPLGVPGAGGYACIPLTTHGRAVGVLNWKTGAGQPLLPGDVQHMEMLARIASLVLMSQSALVQARQEAETDTLTGAFNRRFLDSFLDKQAQSTLRHHQPLGVLMMDLDHFKAFNDRFGHQAGDAILGLFARTAHAAVREGDLVARYGGEEFTVVLPNADQATTLEIAERIRSRFGEASATAGPGAGGPHAQVTVSIGVAIAPADGRHAAELIRAADAALYKAKQAGRNRVMPASS